MVEVMEKTIIASYPNLPLELPEGSCSLVYLDKGIGGPGLKRAAVSCFRPYLLVRYARGSSPFAIFLSGGSVYLLF